MWAKCLSLVLVSMLVSALINGCATQKKANSSLKLQGESPLELNLDVKKYTLKNGLRLLVFENRRLPILSFYTFLNTGGRHESSLQGTTGASHFLEHMLFKTTKNYPIPGTIDQLISAEGGRTNGFTGFDLVGYTEDIPSKALDLLIKINADRMQNLTLQKELFETERNVVMEERKMRYENDPGGQLYLSMMQAVFKGTPYGGSVIGSKKDLKNLTLEQTREFYKNFYTPDNMVIAIVGDVDAKKVKDKIAAAYGKMKRGRREIQEYRKKVDDPKLYNHRAKYGREIKIHGTSPYPIFYLAYRGDPKGTRKSYVMRMLASTLASGKSSHLYQKYIKSRHPYLNSINAFHYGLKYNGVFMIGGELLPKINLNKFKRQLLRNAPSFCTKGITSRSLQKTKNQLMQSYYHGLQTNAAMAGLLANQEIFFGDYEHYKKEIQIYDSITLEEIKKVCQSIFRKGEHLFLSVWKNHPQKRHRRR